MKIYQRKVETFLVCAGLFLSALPQVWSMAVTTEISATSHGQRQYPKHLNVFNRTNTMLLPSYVRSSDYPLNSDLVTTIRWEFINDYGVWGVMFDSFSIPYTDHCSSDYFSIWDPSGRCDHLKIVVCGDSIPEKFLSCSSKIVVEYHSQSPEVRPNFTFRVEHGQTESELQKSFDREFSPSTEFEKERLTMVNEEEKVVIISLSVILPVALAILGMLAFILARHSQQHKSSSQEPILPTKCPSSKKYVHSGNEKDSTVVKLFVETNRKPVKTNKVRLQDLNTERVPLNSYAEMPTNIQICTSVAASDVADDEADFEERPNSYLGLM